MFVRFALVWFGLFPLPLGVWEGLRFVIVALPGLFSSPFFEMFEVVVGKKDYHLKDLTLSAFCHLFQISPFASSRNV